MAEYYAKSDNAVLFEVTKGDNTIGKISYKSWFKFNAEIQIGNSTYQVEPKGFWGTTIELKDKEKLLLTFKMNWNGNIVIQTYFNDVEKGYVFKHVGFFKESFVLADEEGTELIVIKPQMKWNKMNYQYAIATSDIFETLPGREIVLMNSLHCANYYMSMMGA